MDEYMGRRLLLVVEGHVQPNGSLLPLFGCDEPILGR